MIPPLSPDGHLPPGRYRTSLEDIEERFVQHDDFSESTTRSSLFDGLIGYLLDWEHVQITTQADGPILRAIWLAGSFITNKLHPADIDVTPIIDGVIADSVAGRPGSGGLKDLTRNRDSIKRRYGVEVFPVRWHPVVHPFDPRVDLTGNEAAYLSDRGKMDDWWQRCRIDGQDVPTAESCDTRRGYLEVVVT